MSSGYSVTIGNASKDLYSLARSTSHDLADSFNDTDDTTNGIISKTVNTFKKGNTALNFYTSTKNDIVVTNTLGYQVSGTDLVNSRLVTNFKIYDLVDSINGFENADITNCNKLTAFLYGAGGGGGGNFGQYRGGGGGGGGFLKVVLDPKLYTRLKIHTGKGGDGGYNNTTTTGTETRLQLHTASSKYYTVNQDEYNIIAIAYGGTGGTIGGNNFVGTGGVGGSHYLPANIALTNENTNNNLNSSSFFFSNLTKYGQGNTHAATSNTYGSTGGTIADSNSSFYSIKSEGSNAVPVNNGNTLIANNANYRPTGYGAGGTSAPGKNDTGVGTNGTGGDGTKGLAVVFFHY